MALKFLNKILKKKEERVRKDGTGETAAEVVVEREGSQLAAKTERTSTTSKTSRSEAAGVLTNPHVTEKTSSMTGENKYAFVVSGGANKLDVKRAVEARYGVNILGVNIVSIPGKERRRGRQVGWKQGYKKAIVTLKEGQSIEFT